MPATKGMRAVAASLHDALQTAHVAGRYQHQHGYRAEDVAGRHQGAADEERPGDVPAGVLDLVSHERHGLAPAQREHDGRPEDHVPQAGPGGESACGKGGSGAMAGEGEPRHRDQQGNRKPGSQRAEVVEPAPRPEPDQTDQGGEGETRQREADEVVVVGAQIGAPDAGQK